MTTRRTCILSVCVGLLVSNLACGSKGLHGPATDAVSGTVKFKGSPLADAVVTFHPNTKEGRSAVGKTTSAGSFQLTTIKTDDGAMPGEYRVTVSKMVDEGAPNTAAPFDMAAPAQPAKYKSVIPQKYSKPETSELTATVKKGGPNKADLVLTE